LCCSCRIKVHKRKTLNAQRQNDPAAVGARGYNYSWSFVLATP
jgi:hypothetical protein